MDSGLVIGIAILQLIVGFLLGCLYSSKKQHKALDNQLSTFAQLYKKDLEALNSVQQAFSEGTKDLSKNMVSNVVSQAKNATHPKLGTFNEYVDKYGDVDVFLDATHPLVDVPEDYRTDTALAINLVWGHRSPDYAVDNWGIHEKLSFNGCWYACAIPWEAIYIIGSKKVDNLYFWESSCPNPDLMAAIRRGKDVCPSDVCSPEVGSPEVEFSIRKGHLGLVKSISPGVAVQADEKEPKGGPDVA